MTSLPATLKGKENWGLALLFLLLTLILAGPADAQSFPALTGRVVDAAQLLPADQATALEAKLAQLEQQSGRQMVVATVPSLQDYPIEEYGYRLGRHWGIGDKKANDGLILLIAPNERKVRIEVGYGLEGLVTDALASVIIQRQILPRFREGDMAGGIVTGADALIQLLQLPPDEAQARAEKLVDEARRDSGDDIPVALIFWIIVILFVVGSTIVNRLGGGRRYRRGGVPIVLWGPGSGGGWGGGSGGGWGGGSGGGFSGGGGSFGGGGSSGSW